MKSRYHQRAKIVATYIIYMAALLLLAALAAGCCPCKKLADSHYQKDSVRVEYVERVITEYDTISITLPVEVKEVETLDTISELETTSALSVAIVSGGVLRHTLRTKSPIMATAPVTTITRDSVIYRDKVVTDTQTIKVNELTKWQRAQIIGFWIAISALAIFTFLAIFAKKLRKNG